MTEIFDECTDSILDGDIPGTPRFSAKQKQFCLEQNKIEDFYGAGITSTNAERKTNCFPNFETKKVNMC